MLGCNSSSGVALVSTTLKSIGGSNGVPHPVSMKAVRLAANKCGGFFFMLSMASFPSGVSDSLLPRILRRATNNVNDLFLKIRPPRASDLVTGLWTDLQTVDVLQV